MAKKTTKKKAAPKKGRPQPPPLELKTNLGQVKLALHEKYVSQARTSNSKPAQARFYRKAAKYLLQAQEAERAAAQ